jgi:plastocyanin
MARCAWSRAWLIAIATLSACGENGAGPGDSPPSSVAVDVGNDFFRSIANGSTEPAFDTVAVNGTVTWTWIQVGDHGVGFDDPGLPAEVVWGAIGSQHSVTFPAAGTYDYYCSIHGPQMGGRVVVR